MSSSHAPTSGPTAFRSHWSAPPQHGRAPGGDMYDYDPNYQSNNQSNNQSKTTNQSASQPSQGKFRNQSNDQSINQSTNQSTVINLDGAPAVDERAPLLSHSHSDNQSNNQSINQSNNSNNKLFGLFNSWSSLCCCLLPLVLLVLLIVRYMLDGKSINQSINQPIDHSHAIAAQCDPFSFNSHSVDLKHDHGLVAYLSVVEPDNQSISQSINQFEANSQRVNGTLFFSQLNTPTRLFTDRFVARNKLDQSINQSNKHSTNQSINQSVNQITLPSEFFFLDFHTRLLPPKKYRNENIQLAIICDDGCIVQSINQSIKKTNKQSFNHYSESDQSINQLLIDNDGIHSTRFAASNQSINFSDNQPINLSVKYFQGPPAHIALYMMYRLSTNQSINQSVSQFDEGNDVFWHVSHQPNTESKSTSQFDRLIDLGWRVIPADWYWLPKKYDSKNEVDSLLADGRDPCNL